jgi:hypothetical protein
MIPSALAARSRALAESGSPIGGLVTKKPKLEPPKPLCPDGSPYHEPVQLELPFAIGVRQTEG